LTKLAILASLGTVASLAQAASPEIPGAASITTAAGTFGVLIWVIYQLLADKRDQQVRQDKRESEFAAERREWGERMEELTDQIRSSGTALRELVDEMKRKG
jgi:hypothetical protein